MIQGKQCMGYQDRVLYVRNGEYDRLEASSWMTQADLNLAMIGGRGWLGASASCCKCMRDLSMVRVRVRSCRACSSFAAALMTGWLRFCLSTAST